MPYPSLMIIFPKEMMWLSFNIKNLSYLLQLDNSNFSPGMHSPLNFSGTGPNPLSSKLSDSGQIPVKWKWTQNSHPILIAARRNQEMEKKKCTKPLPVSMTPTITLDSGSNWGWLYCCMELTPKNSHECVVWIWFILLSNTETTDSLSAALQKQWIRRSTSCYQWQTMLMCRALLTHRWKRTLSLHHWRSYTLEIFI